MNKLKIMKHIYTIILASLFTINAHSQSDVVFSVNMSGVTFDNVYVYGTINGWTPDDIELTDADNDGIYQATVPLNDGAYEYKFQYKSSGADVFEDLPNSLVGTKTTGTYTNRYIVVDGNTTSDTPVFNGASVTGTDFEVVFNVDMSDYSGSFTNVNINGTNDPSGQGLGNWCGSCMGNFSDTDGDNIWTLEIPLDAGSYEFKFTLDGWTAAEDFTSVINGGIVNNNRYLNVDGNMTVNAVWNTAAVLSFDEFNNFDIAVYPNPVENKLNVSAGVTVDKVSIFDLTGREVLRATPNAAAFSLDVSSLNKGLYLVTLKAGKQEMTTKLVK